MAAARVLLALCATAPVVLAGLGCTKSTPKGSAASDLGAPPPSDLPAVVEAIYQGGMKGGWKDQGWCPHVATGPGPAELHFAGLGGWILAKPGLKLESAGSLVFRVHPPTGEGDVLEVRLESTTVASFPSAPFCHWM